MSYYYNSLQNTNKENSVAEKLEKWGSDLINPYQKQYKGRTFKKESGNLVEVETDSKNLTIGAKVKVLLGVILKVIAISLSPEIKSNYERMSSDNKQTAETALKAVPYKKDGEEVLACCLCCSEICIIFECCLFCCA